MKKKHKALNQKWFNKKKIFISKRHNNNIVSWRRWDENIDGLLIKINEDVEETKSDENNIFKKFIFMRPSIAALLETI